MSIDATRTAGVLGGMGPEATVEFMSRVVALTAAETDQDHVRLLVDQNPKVPSRQAAGPAQRAVIEQTLVDMAATLEQAGADFLVMPCNTAHAFIAKLLQSISVPFLHLVAETVTRVGEILPDGGNVGLLATDACLEANLYQQAMRHAGLPLLLPSSAEQRTIMQLVFRIKRGDKGAGVTAGMLGCVESMLGRGAEVIVIGCTEIPLVLSSGDLDVPLVSSTDILALRTIELCRGAGPLPAHKS